MAWNADVYNQFKSERAAPFYDLLSLVEERGNLKVIDLGCGTGELTRELAQLPGSTVLGIDSSAEMLEKSAQFASGNLTFIQRTVQEELQLEEKYDVIFSNAALQWIDDHEALIPALIGKLQPQGQLLIQMPSQHHNLANIVLTDLSREHPYAATLGIWKRTSSVLETSRYADIFFEHGARSMTALEKVYPMVLANSDALYDFVSGTALIPYLERLPDSLHANFIELFKNRLRDAFPGSPAFYPFRRMILAAAF